VVERRVLRCPGLGLAFSPAPLALRILLVSHTSPRSSLSQERKRTRLCHLLPLQRPLLNADGPHPSVLSLAARIPVPVLACAQISRAYRDTVSYRKTHHHHDQHGHGQANTLTHSWCSRLPHFTRYLTIPQ